MDISIIKKINNEYEQKRLLAINELVKRKNEIFSKVPRLKEIEEEINNYAIKSTRLILVSETDEKYTYVKDLENKIESLKTEKKKILDSANISEKQLEPIYECNICNDTGFINNVQCNCYKQRLLDFSYNNSNLSNLTSLCFDKFDENLYSDEVNKSLNISPKQNILNIKRMCLNFIDNFDNTTQKNLLFTGETGLGKTFLSSCIANELLKQGKTVLYQTSPILMDTLIEYKFRKDGNSEKIYKDVFDVDLLIIDDLGVEALNSMKCSELFTIINTRLLNTKKITKTIISTNLPIEDMFKIYDERIMSRIIGNYTISKFIGDDIRIKNR